VAITFDAATKRIVLDSSFADVGDIYSRWKEWVRTSDNAKYLPAFRAIGGDPLGGALYVSLYTFLVNGWRIRPMESNHTLILEGNISVDGGGDPVVPTIGSYRVLVQYTVPERAQAYDAGGGGGATAAEIAAAVRAELAPELAKMNELTFTTPNVVDASCSGGSGAPGVFYWNGTTWVLAGT
jgi:hypothetical protein